MSKYTELKAKHQAEVNAFPFGFAFNQSKFDADPRMLHILERVIAAQEDG